MKEKLREGHENVANNSRDDKTHKPSTSSYDYDDDWDFGVGNLIIDLDSDIEKTKTQQQSPIKSPNMSSFEPSITADNKGLKMKIKRKNANSKTAETKADTSKDNTGVLNLKTDQKSGHDTGLKLSPTNDKTKCRGLYKKDRFKGKADASNGNPFLMPATFLPPPSKDSSSAESASGSFSMGIKREPFHDPYEFGADEKNNDTILPNKKMKFEKMEMPHLQSSTVTAQMLPPKSSKDASTDMVSVAIATEPECLGPCEPGTSVNLEGIVWHENDNGMLVVNVTWRGKTYVGTLMDATKHEWAPPRLQNDSPTSDLDARTPRGRGKRGRTAANSVETGDLRKLRKGRRGTAANFIMPSSPAKTEPVIAGAKRKGRPAELDLASSTEELRTSKRGRTSSRNTPVTDPPSPALIECPEPNCNKKYRHVNGLRYHQTHAHQENKDSDKYDADSLQSPTKSENAKEKAKSKSDKKLDKRVKSPLVSANTTKSDTLNKSCGKEQMKLKVAEANKGQINNSDNINKSDPVNNVNKSDKDKEKTSTEIAFTPKNEKDNNEHNKANERKLVPARDANKQNSSNIARVKSTMPAILPKPAVTASVIVSSANLVTTTSPLAITTTASQIFQISSASIGCMNTTVVATTPALSPQQAIFTQPSAQNILTTVASLQVPTVVQMVPKTDEKLKRSDKIEPKLKPKPSQRPIVPAPIAPQMVALASNVTMATTNRGPIVVSSAHAPISTSVASHTSNLKPIQPKPTIMGDTTKSNPSLESLKDRKIKQKRKSREQTSPNSTLDNKSDVKSSSASLPTPIASSSTSKTPDMQHNQAKVAPVIKPDTKMTISSNNVDTSKKRIVTTAGTARIPTPTKASNLQPIQTSPLSLKKEKVKTHLEIKAEPKDSETETNCCSPAYSDISDDGAPSLENENDNTKKTGPLTVNSGEARADSLPSYNSMLSLYSSQPPCLLPALSSSPTLPPISQTPQPQLGKVPKDKVASAIKKETIDDKKDAGHDSSLQDNMTEEEQRKLEYQMQQQLYYQQQLYLAACHGYPLDQYHMQQFLATDPNYAKQQEMIKLKMATEQTDKEKNNDKEKQKDLNRTSTARVTGEAKSELTRSEQSLNDKKNENHQIIKENIELTAHMKQKSTVHSVQGRNISSKTPMYKSHLGKSDDHKSQTLTSQSKSEHRPSGGQLDKRDSRKDSKDVVRKTVHDNRDLSRDKPRDLTTDSRKHEDRLTGATSISSAVDKRSSPINTPTRQLKAGLPSTPVTDPSPRSPASRSPGGLQNRPKSPFAGQGPQVPFAPPGMYHPLHYDPHYAAAYGPRLGMNQVMGYPNPSQYMHPSQVPRYALSPAEEKEKALSTSPRSHDMTKSVDSHRMSPSQYYNAQTPLHKIHELEKEGKVAPSSSEKKTDAPISKSVSSSPTSYEKHRDSPPAQRHLHTHHHTHVVGPPPYIYDPAYAMLVPGVPPVPHPFNVPK